MSVFASSGPVHGAGEAVVRVQEDEQLGAFESRPDGLQSGIVEALGEAGGTEDNSAYMGQGIKALDHACDL